MNLSKSTSILESYSDPHLETYFENLENDLSVFDVKAKQDGPENIPSILKQHSIGVIIPIKSVIQKAIDFNYSRNQMYSDIAVVQGLRTTASEKAFTLEKEKNEKEKKLVPLKNEQKGLKEKCKYLISSTLKIFIPALFGICEGVLTYKMVLTNSLSVIVAFFLALLTALIAAFGLHFGANFICKAKTVHLKRIRYLIVLSIAFVFASALGFWRASSFSNSSDINSQIDLHQQTSSSANASLWPFVIISFASFLVALCFEIKYWLSDEEKKQLKKYEEKSAEVKKEELAVKALNREIEDIKANSNFDSASIMRKQEYACGNEYRLVSLAQQVVSRYESINADFRKDNQCPAFFGDQINFDFKLYFTQLFNSIKGKQ